MSSMRSNGSRLTRTRAHFSSGERAPQTRPSWGVCALLALGSLSLVPAAWAQTQAHAARSTSVRDEGNLRFIHSSGSTLSDEGTATGTIPGRVKVLFTYNGNPTVGAQITIYGHAGQIHAHATAKLSSPTSPNPSFKGTLTITGGTGRYAHAHGGGRLYGIFHRRSYGLVVQTQGTLTY
jgi:hypothetical protein